MATTVNETDGPITGETLEQRACLFFTAWTNSHRARKTPGHQWQRWAELDEAAKEVWRDVARSSDTEGHFCCPSCGPKSVHPKVPTVPAT